MLRSGQLALCVILAQMMGCSYHFQGARNPLVELGVQRIYVSQFRNRTYRPGIEQLFTTAMIREIRKSRSFELVGSQESADAVLYGEVVTADSAVSSSRSVLVGSRNFDVGAEYNASVSCRVTLVDRNQRLIFSQSVSGNKVHPGAVPPGDTGATAQERDAGATAPLVNDSEQRLAIQFLASQMMASVYQRMVDTF